MASGDEFIFFTYPAHPLPDLTSYVLLTPHAPPITARDAKLGILLLDGTWRYTTKMTKQLPSSLARRSLPSQIITAYPRRQDEERGLASIEALFTAYHILGRPTGGLLESYQWAERFLDINEFLKYGEDKGKHIQCVTTTHHSCVKVNDSNATARSETFTS